MNHSEIDMPAFAAVIYGIDCHPPSVDAHVVARLDCCEQRKCVLGTRETGGHAQEQTDENGIFPTYATTRTIRPGEHTLRQPTQVGCVR